MDKECLENDALKHRPLGFSLSVNALDKRNWGSFSEQNGHQTPKNEEDRAVESHQNSDLCTQGYPDIPFFLTPAAAHHQNAGRARDTNAQVLHVSQAKRGPHPGRFRDSVEPPMIRITRD